MPASTGSGRPISRRPKQRVYMAVSPATTATAAPGTPLRATMLAASWSNAGSARRTAAAAATRCAAAASRAARRADTAGATGTAPASGAEGADGEAEGAGTRGTTGTSGEAEGAAGGTEGRTDAVADGEAAAEATMVAVRSGEGTRRRRLFGHADAAAGEQHRRAGRREHARAPSVSHVSLLDARRPSSPRRRALPHPPVRSRADVARPAGCRLPTTGGRGDG